jgi:YbbR domain-containing protein
MPTWVRHNLGLKLFSLFLAALLWVVVLGEQKVETTIGVPLDLNLPADLFVVNDPPDQLEVRVRGPRTLANSLAARDLWVSEIPVKLVEGEITIPIRDDFVRVPRGVQVVDVNPRRIRLVLEAAVEREVEIAPRIEGSPPDGYTVQRVTTIPPRVRVVGPSSELRRITQVRTLPISLTGQTASFSARVLLEPVGRHVRLEENASIVVEVEIGQRRS